MPRSAWPRPAIRTTSATRRLGSTANGGSMRRPRSIREKPVPQALTRRQPDRKPAVGALTPALPLGLRQVLNTGLETRFTDSGDLFWVERTDWAVPPISEAGRESAKHWLVLLEQNLEPVDPAELGVAIGVFLGHRWRGRDDEMSPVVRKAIHGDWIADLAEYPQWAVSAAMQTWRRTERWAPTIADIRGLCEAEVAQDRRTLRLLNRLLA